MNRLKGLINIWTGIGVVAGFFLVPRVMSGLGQQGWNPNWGYWRPIGNYGIGSFTGLNPLNVYAGGMRQLGSFTGLNPLDTYAGGASMGQAYRSGENLLPFGCQGDYGPPWQFAPTSRNMM